ncbi:U4/U6.U5 small nuclear ribonucleoprotein 27 kDa protein [Trametes pubescens]|uniref:U4/U6.U5 small nuclear ribonucleoprotein 27 kDa protein n=1 Tax=Trametes pubescens TaxID=154538 RepID=A0A1M2VUD2_TRAPU|nr:U4/U6.U5 small nuclear ribonucleoprotein 27 kDa protein [Trametes pubescens]
MSSRREPIRRDRSRDRDDRGGGRDRYPPRGAPRRSRSRSPPRRGERNWRGSGMRLCNVYYNSRSVSTVCLQTGEIPQVVIEKTIVATGTGGMTVGTIDETTGGATTGTGETTTATQDGNPFRLPGLTETECVTGTGTLGTPEVEPSGSRPPTEAEAPADGAEEGETMDATNEDDAAMMAMMGLSGFGTTKGKHVEGNQEGSADVKKMRTWRQYMNRRGGFNRPLDKIK